MKQAEYLEGIAHEQYGVQKAKATDVQALNTFLFYELVRQKKFTSTSVFTDIISNYELVVHIIGYLALQIVNAPKELIHCTFSTLQNMVQLVRTSFRDSANTYGGDI